MLRMEWGALPGTLGTYLLAVLAGHVHIEVAYLTSVIEAILMTRRGNVSFAFDDVEEARRAFDRIKEATAHWGVLTYLFLRLCLKEIRIGSSFV